MFHLDTIGCFIMKQLIAIFKWLNYFKESIIKYAETESKHIGNRR